MYEKIKPDQLKEALSEIFSEYGKIIEIVAKRNLKAKGQAFIVFDSVDSAQNAIEDIQGFELFDKPMALDYAKTKSDATVQREAAADDFEAHKRRRLAEKGAQAIHTILRSFILKQTLERKQAAEAADQARKLKRPAANAETATRPIKSSRGAGLKSSNPAAGAVIPEEYLPPNKILFVQNLPDEYGVDGLTAIFGRFDGFREVRLVPGRKGIAFVEYETEAGSINAKENTAGMILGEEGKPMKVVYQRQ